MNINITIIGQAISFIIFVWFCMKYVWTPMISVIEKRQKELSNIFLSAEKSKKNAEVKYIQASSCLKQAKEEAKLIIEQAYQYKDQLIKEAQCRAQIEKKIILSQAYNEISNKKKCVTEELQKEVSEIVMFGIEKIMGCSMNKYIDRNLIDKVLNELLICNINEIIND